MDENSKPKLELQVVKVFPPPLLWLSQYLFYVYCLGKRASARDKLAPKQTLLLVQLYEKAIW
jgi:hypothetical protein